MDKFRESELEFRTPEFRDRKRVVARWAQLFEGGFRTSPRGFYGLLEEAIRRRNVPHAKIARKYYKEGGIFSRSRQYLVVRRKGYRFHICASPFGGGFFVSSWLTAPKPGLAGIILKIRYVGPLFLKVFFPDTFYRLDNALMFMRTIHLALLEVLDDITIPTGMRSFSEVHRKPILSDFFNR